MHVSWSEMEILATKAAIGIGVPTGLAEEAGLAVSWLGRSGRSGATIIWRALQNDDEERAYEVYYHICAITALQMQAGLDGFLAIEKHLMVKRGLFKRANRRRPYKWELDEETQAETDRLFAMLQDQLSA